MNLNGVLSFLIKQEKSFPATKLVWDGQFDAEKQDLTAIPKIFPSEYVRELRLDTAERHALVSHQLRHFAFRKPGCELTIIPSIIVFQNYNAGDKQSVNINIRNISKNLQKVTLLMDETHTFEIDVNSARISSFAPGLTITATINLYAEDDRDYYHKLVVSTRSSRFAIPIVGIGGRGILDVEDEYDFKEVPVKLLKSISVPSSNIGTKTARFTLTTEGPFCVTPEKGVVSPLDSFIFSISFISELRGVFEGFLRIKYENGEEVYCKLQAEAVNTNVGLSIQEINFEDTYMGFKSKEIVRIKNDSDGKVDFCWKKFSSTSEFLNSSNKKSIMQQGDGDRRETSVNVGDKFNFGRSEPTLLDSNFSIEPYTGKVQPHSYKDVIIFFSPNVPGPYNLKAYCDLTGNEDRIPLSISGKGLGPKFRLGFDELNIGSICLGGGHAYEISTENISQIYGAIVFEGVSGFLPDVITKIEPERIELAPGQFGAFYLMFHCNGVPRKFYEELRFRIPATEEILYISVRGTITYPQMQFSLGELNFLDISYGSPQTERAVLVNNSLNVVDVVLKFDNDGIEQSLTQGQIVDFFGTHSYRWPKSPQEFTIEPATFTLAPRGFQRLNVTLLSNTYGEYKRKLMVCIAGNNEPIHHLPVVVHCSAPTIVNSRTDIVMEDCYVGFPYPQRFEVYNPTKYTAIYCVIPLPSNKVTFRSTNFVGVLNARSKTTIPFEITTLVAGETLVAHLEVYLIGKNESLLDLSVKITGIPTRLEVNHRHIDFGHIQVLDAANQHFEIMNESPLSLEYTAFMVEGGHSGDTWVIDPSVGTLEPHSTNTIRVQLTLQEIGKQTGLIRIQISNAITFIDVRARVVGIGSSLTFKPMIPKSGILDFGTLFTKSEKGLTFEITNMGITPKGLDWRHVDDPPISVTPPLRARAQRGVVPEVSDKQKKKNKAQAQMIPNRIFQILPAKKHLEPGETATVIFSAQCSYATIVEDTFVLWAHTPKPDAPEESYNRKAPVRRINFKTISPDKPVIVRQIKFKAIFETPKLIFSKIVMKFRIDASPVELTFQEKSSLKIENGCTIPIAAKFQTSYPFSISMKGMAEEHGTNDWSHTLMPGEVIDMTIIFDGRHLRKDKGNVSFESNLVATYEGQTFSENVVLKGEVYFPCVKFNKKLVDFGVVVNGTEAVEEVTATNPCNFCLTYKWYIKPFSTVIWSTNENNADPFEVTESTQTTARTKEGKIRSESLPALKERVESPKQFEIISEVGVLENKAEQLQELSNILAREQSAQSAQSEKEKCELTHSAQNLNLYGESVQYFRDVVHRSRMMQIVGLQDVDREMEDELLYLQQNSEEPKTTGAIDHSELIDIVPLSGVIQSGQTQTFTVVFYGHPDIHFETVAICYLEGGTSKLLSITGRSVQAENALMMGETPPEPIEICTSGYSLNARPSEPLIQARKLKSRQLKLTNAKWRMF